MNNNIESLLANVMIALADEFKDQIVLKGGMQLRLLNSPRSTQDIDYILCSRESKKLLIIKVRKALESITGIKIVSEKMNSRGIFLEILESKLQTKALIEISVLPSTFLNPEPISTAALTNELKMSPRIITAMAIPEAFSHKIAATIERNVMRDLYDLSLYEPLGNFDETTLKTRLSKTSIARAKPVTLNFLDGAKILSKKNQALTEESLQIELYPLLPKSHQAGLLRPIQASVARIVQKMEGLNT